MKFFKKGAILEDLARAYVTWQGRLEVLESGRAALHARVMELQELSLEGQDSPDLQPTKDRLTDLDQKIEAAAGKLAALWRQMEGAVLADIEARRQAAPETQANLDAEYREKCERAGTLFAEALALVEDLGLDKGSLIGVLGLPGAGKILRRTDSVLGDAFNQARRQAPALTKPSYIQKVNEHRIFTVLSPPGHTRESFFRLEIAAAIRTAGGQPSSPDRKKPPDFAHVRRIQEQELEARAHQEGETT